MIIDSYLSQFDDKLDKFVRMIRLCYNPRTMVSGADLPFLGDYVAAVVWRRALGHNWGHLNLKVFGDILYVRFSEAHSTWEEKKAGSLHPVHLLHSERNDRTGVCRLPVAVCVWAMGYILSMDSLEWCFFSLWSGKTTLVSALVIRLHSRITPGSGCKGRSFSRTSCQQLLL